MKIQSFQDLKLPLLLVLLGVAGFFACQEESDLLQEDANFTDEVMNFHFNRAPQGPRCFQLIFPVVVDFPDGSSDEAADPEALRSILMAWKEANPAAEERPTIAFPHDILLPGGDTVMVNDADELKEFTEDCRRRKRIPRPCYRLIYPLTLQFSDGSTVEVNNRREQHDAVYDWKEANPDDTVRPEIVFPYDVELPNGESVTVGSAEELRGLLVDCRGRFVRQKVRKNCFKLAFPVNVDFPDGTQVTYKDHQSMREGIRTWLEANPDTEEKPEVAFPHEVELKDGTIVTVNNEEEVKALIEECRTGN